jgi:SAM-dependent methyltransferase
MSIRTGREKKVPTARSTQLIQDCSASIEPNDATLVEWHKAYLLTHQQRLAFDLDLVRERVPAGSTVLECGSVPPLLTAALAASDYSVTGLDIDPERYATAIEGADLRVMKCNLEMERLPFEDGFFDAVVFNELFEHLRIDLIHTMSEVLRVLKTDGTLLLSSPNLRSLGGMKNFLFHNQSYSCSGDLYWEYTKLTKFGHMGHVREYTTAEVIEFLHDVGFSVKELVYRGSYTSRVSRMVIGLFPGLSPYVSYVAARPGERALQEEV